MLLCGTIEGLALYYKKYTEMDSDIKKIPWHKVHGIILA